MALKTKTCDICKANFKQTYHLKQHVSVIHEQKDIHNCDYCGKKFKWPHNLKKPYEDT